MKLSTFSLISSLTLANAFVAPQLSRLDSRNMRYLSSLAEPSAAEHRGMGRSKDEIALELASGKLLEGGQVIDFSSVKGESRAEAALAAARKAVIAARSSNASAKSQLQTETILGINNEVISEVGHDLGTFADEETVQKCASFLRSMAPPGFFEPLDTGLEQTSFTVEDKAQLKSIIRRAYDESGEVTSAFAKTFYMGTQLLPEKAREAIWAIYVWCRRTDEIVDAPRDNHEDMLTDLSSWELRLENLWTFGIVEDVFDLCLLDVRIQYPSLEIIPFVDMIRGMLMDVPDLGQDRYETFDELHLYCYRVAGTVGLMSMPVFGCAKGYNPQIARCVLLFQIVPLFHFSIDLRLFHPAVNQRYHWELHSSLPIFFAMWVKMLSSVAGYICRAQDMERFGVTEEQIFAQRMDENYAAMMKFQVERARKYYDRARRGVFMLAEESRLPVQSSLDAYGMILLKIEENNYDSLTTRAYTTKWEKLFVLPFSWYRTLEVSKDIPLPGDRPFQHI